MTAKHYGGYRMRIAMALGLILTLTAGISAQEKKTEAPPPRYGVEADLQTYKQGSAKETLASIAEAVRRTRIDYVVAQLTDPIFIDAKVTEFGGDFQKLVKEVEEHLNDPKLRQEFVRFLKEGVVEESGTSAKVTLKDVPKRQMTLRKSGERWFLDNENEADKPKK
jgi:hypothetical protein